MNSIGSSTTTPLIASTSTLTSTFSLSTTTPLLTTGSTSLSSIMVTTASPITSSTNSFSTSSTSIIQTTPIFTTSLTSTLYVAPSLTLSPAINASSLFSQNNTGGQVNNVLKTYTGDLSACLANCSNQGLCTLNSMQQYICQCNQFRTGSACQSDSRPCSSGPCLNGGICNDTMNETSFECTCQSNLFYGIYCEKKVDLCKNSTVCFNNQGYCIMNGSQPVCKCKLDYSGINCEIISNSLMVKKCIINASTIIAICFLVCFAIMVLCCDYTKYFLIKKNNKKKETRNKKISLLSKKNSSTRHSNIASLI